jgi:HpaII restriction endonuclease
MAEDPTASRNGNIGEHSEFLAFATIIADGYLDLTDPTGEIAKGRLSIAEVSREAPGQKSKGSKKVPGGLIRKAFFLRNDEVWIRKEIDGTEKKLCPRAEVLSLVSDLKRDLVAWTESSKSKSSDDDPEDDEGSSRPLESTNRLLKLLDVEELKSPSDSKSDLYLTFLQPTGASVIQGFSVKSLMGANSCLINHSAATLMTYEIFNSTPVEVLEVEVGYVREVAEAARASKRKQLEGPQETKLPKKGPATVIPAMDRKGIQLKFSSVPDEVFRQNLMSIDTCFPQMLAHVIHYRFLHAETSPLEIAKAESSVKMMEALGYSRSCASRDLEDKIKTLFKRYAQGMNSQDLWDGATEVKGGWVLVIKDGRVTGYCFEDDDKFRDYLFKSTYFDTPSTKRTTKEKKLMGAYVGRPYSVGGRTFIDLSLTVKFRKRSVEDHEKPRRRRRLP